MKELHQVVEAAAVDGCRVRVAFENGVEGLFDCTPYMAEKYWERLANPSFFRQVRAAWGTLCWPGEIDIDPEEVWEGCEKMVGPSAG